MANVDEFLHGFAVALATLNKLHDLPTVCRDVAHSNGLDRRSFRDCGADPFTMEQIGIIFGNNGARRGEK